MIVYVVIINYTLEEGIFRFCLFYNVFSHKVSHGIELKNVEEYSKCLI